MSDEKRRDTREFGVMNASSAPAEEAKGGASRARNRTVLLSPEHIGQIRANMTPGEQAPVADPVSELLPPVNWDYSEEKGAPQQAAPPEQPRGRGTEGGGSTRPRTATQSFETSDSEEFVSAGLRPGADPKRSTVGFGSRPAFSAGGTGGTRGARGSSGSFRAMSEEPPRGRPSETRDAGGQEPFVQSYEEPPRARPAQEPGAVQREGTSRDAISREAIMRESVPAGGERGFDRTEEPAYDRSGSDRGGYQERYPSPPPPRVPEQRSAEPRYEERSPEPRVAEQRYESRAAEAAVSSGGIRVVAKGGKSKLLGFLVSFDTDPNGEVVELRSGRWMITSRPTDQGDFILIDDSTVSPLHAIIRATPDGQVQVLDQLSEYGSTIIRSATGQEEPLAGALCAVQNGDCVRFGNRQFAVCLLPRIKAR